MQGMHHIRQDFRTAMLFARSLAQAGRFQQAPQLTRQNRRLGSQVLGKEFVVGIVQKRNRANHFVQHHEGGCQERVRPIFRRNWKHNRLHLIGKDRPPLPDSFGGHGTLIGTQPQSYKPFGQFSIGLFSNQFIREVAAPEVDARHAKEFSRRLAEHTDQAV